MSYATHDEIIKILSLIGKEKGYDFLEQKFPQILDAINLTHKNEIIYQELYSSVFPELAPKIKLRNLVFENSSRDIYDKPLFHPSETIYRQWLIEFNSCSLIENHKGALTINVNRSLKVLDEFNSWSHNFPVVKGRDEQRILLRNIEKLPLGIPVPYSSIVPVTSKRLLEQINAHKILKISTETEVIEMHNINGNIMVLRKKKFEVFPETLKVWLENFGIRISLTTASYIISVGMPYCGYNVNMSSLLRFTGNGYGVIGILAYNLSYLMRLKSAGQLYINPNFHPLNESVVLALSRTERFFGTTP